MRQSHSPRFGLFMTSIRMPSPRIVIISGEIKPTDNDWRGSEALNNANGWLCSETNPSGLQSG